MHKPINIKLSDEELEKVFTENLDIERNRSLVAEAIMGLDLSTHERETLFRASIGLRPDIPYQVGDVVFISTDYLSDSNWDRDKMATHAFLVELYNTVYVQGKVIEIKEWSPEPFVIEISIIRQGSASDEVIISKTQKSLAVVIHEDWINERLGVISE